jgi:hypothetical protein
MLLHAGRITFVKEKEISLIVKYHGAVGGRHRGVPSYLQPACSDSKINILPGPPLLLSLSIYGDVSHQR